MILRNRKLFQCQNVKVQLGQSKTGCHSYEVYVHECLLVVCSNKWVEQLHELQDGDRAWLEANQVLVVVQEALWQPLLAIEDDHD